MPDTIMIFYFEAILFTHKETQPNYVRPNVVLPESG